MARQGAEAWVVSVYLVRNAMLGCICMFEEAVHWSWGVHTPQYRQLHDIARRRMLLRAVCTLVPAQMAVCVELA